MKIVVWIMIVILMRAVAIAETMTTIMVVTAIVIAVIGKLCTIII